MSNMGEESGDPKIIVNDLYYLSLYGGKTLVSLIHIRWVVIYPVHSVIQHYLNT